MSVAIMVLGQSGTGKSASLRNMDPAQTLLIQCIKKPLPFNMKGWAIRTKANPSGNIYQTDNSEHIERALRASVHPVVVIDDYQAVLVNQLMVRSEEIGFKKFEAIGKSAWNIFNACGDLAATRRIYVMAHTQIDDFGNVRMKTVGKMVDSTIVPESYFTIVLRTELINGQYIFSTQTNGQDPCKSPIDMFPEKHIDNDLAVVDRSICNFYGISYTEVTA